MKSVIAAAVVALLTAGVAKAQDGTTPPVAGAVTLVQAGHLLDRPGQAPRGTSTVKPLRLCSLALTMRIASDCVLAGVLTAWSDQRPGACSRTSCTTPMSAA